MKVIFVTRESKEMPGVRVRGHGFANFFREFGINSSVFSFADNLGAPSGAEESTLRARDIIKFNFQALQSLAGKNSVLFMQRCHYHSFAPVFLKLIKGVKLVFDLDDWEARENSRYYFGKFSDSQAEMAMQFVAKNSDICIGASDFLVRYLKSYNENVLYVPTGVNTDFFKPNENISKKSGVITLSWIGTMHRKDNLENILFLIDCFKELRDGAAELRLEILGEGIYFPEVRNAVDANRMPEILLKKWISPNEIPAYLNDIDIGIMPLVQDTKFNKAKSPTRLFEYMSMEKPVVVSRIGESKLIIEDGRDGFLASDKKEFVEKLRLLINDPVLRADFGKSARKKVLASYSLRTLAFNLAEKLKQVF